MLTRLFENNQIKCEQYWPDEGFEEEYGTFYVANENEIDFQFYIERKIKITHRHTGKSKNGNQTKID